MACSLILLRGCELGWEFLNALNIPSSARNALSNCKGIGLISIHGLGPPEGTVLKVGADLDPGIS